MSDEVVRNQMGRMLKLMRTYHGDTIVELVEKSGVGSASIMEIERGVRLPCKHELALMMGAYDIPEKYAELFDESDDSKARSFIAELALGLLEGNETCGNKKAKG